jgi:hypothetical protein
MPETVNRLQDNSACHGELSARIFPLRRREDPQHIELIVDVVVAFTRLRESVLRIVVMLAGKGADTVLADGIEAQPFDVLLSALADHARRARFRRLPELNEVIERARLAEQHRDLIYAQAPGDADTVLREVAGNLERLDTEFVGLCVAHVLEHHEIAAPVQRRRAMGLAHATN